MRLNKWMREFLTLALSLALTLAPGSVHALLIDNFSTDHGELIDFSGGSGALSSVDGTGITGGQRDALAGSNTASAILGATRFNVTGGYAHARVDANGLGQVRLDYDGIGNPFDELSSLSLDLTDGGASDRFIIDVAAVSGTVGLGINVGVSGGQIPSFWQSPSFTTISAAGLVEIPFALFNLILGPLPTPDFAAAEQVAFFWIMDAEESIHFDALCTGSAGAGCNGTPVPEPGTLALMALGLLGVAVLRRKQGMSRNI